MRWQGRRQSDNVEDRRGAGPKMALGGGIGTVAIVIIYLLLGGNPGEIFNQMSPGGQQSGEYRSTEEENQLKEFVSVVLGDTEDVWDKLFRERRSSYERPKLVLFTDYVESACGQASSASGPFYCPGDSKVYIDLSFCDQLKNRFGAPGDFAIAYVIAHEVGHHVQNLLGITDKVDRLRHRMSEKEFNKISVRLELQADFLAGVWAHHNQKINNILEEGDIEEALNAASAVGDDAIQKQTQGHVVPDAFTHGTSEQRKKWFYKGFKSGRLEDGDTFNDVDL